MHILVGADGRMDGWMDERRVHISMGSGPTDRQGSMVYGGDELMVWHDNY